MTDTNTSDSGRYTRPLAVNVISDVVCPWCYVGKRRLESAITAAAVPVVVRWHPYQLDPTIPQQGKDRRAYMEAKFGSAERIHEIHARLDSVGMREGITFAFDRIRISPNTLNAHRVIRWAGEAGVQDSVVEALFRAYFVDGRDIGDATVLAEIAAASGVNREETVARLASDKDRELVSQEIRSARELGVTGVPTFVLDGRYGLVGAQPAEDIAAALRQVAEARVSPAT